MEELIPLVNGLAGLASLVIAGFMYPTLKALRTLAESHEERLDAHDVRLTQVEAPPRPSPRRRRT